MKFLNYIWCVNTLVILLSNWIQNLLNIDRKQSDKIGWYIKTLIVLDAQEFYIKF